MLLDARSKQQDKVEQRPALRNRSCCLHAGQMTDSAMLTFTLRRLRVSVILLAPFVKLQRKFLRQVLTIFGGADKAPRLQALLFIRHMAAMLPPPALELALKVCFLSCKEEIQTGHANWCCCHTNRSRHACSETIKPAWPCGVMHKSVSWSG